MKSIPKHLQPQSTSDAPTSIGTSFAADVMRRYRQFILIMRQTVSLYTMATHFEVDGETCIDKEKIANGFNKFFTGAVTRLLEVGQVVKPINNPFKLF